MFVMDLRLSTPHQSICRAFFWCYHSAEMPFLIDMSMPGLIKIPQVSREVFPYPRVLLSPRAIVPRCAVQIRGPYSPKIARSKMGYPARKMSSTRAFRGGLGRFPDIARPPVHRLTPNIFHPLRKSLLRHANKNFRFAHFSNFPKL